MSFLQGVLKVGIVLCYSMTIKQEDVLYIKDFFFAKDSSYLNGNGGGSFYSGGNTSFLMPSVKVCRSNGRL